MWFSEYLRWTVRGGFLDVDWNVVLQNLVDSRVSKKAHDLRISILPAVIIRMGREELAAYLLVFWIPVVQCD